MQSRIQLPHAVSASNLFKCCAPFHGVVLFRRHHPLEFTLPELGDLMRVSQEWFRRARETDPAARFPLLVWNCLSRAGASQFHGHAQVMLSSVRSRSRALLGLWGLFQSPSLGTVPVSVSGDCSSRWEGGRAQQRTLLVSGNALGLWGVHS